MRRLLLLVALAAVALFVATAAAPVSAKGPPVATAITIHVLPTGTQTFTATGGVVCSSGTSYDEFLSIKYGRTVNVVHVRKVLTCDDPIGSMTLLYEVRQVPDLYAEVIETGSWTVLSGTGAYAGLHGGGSEVGGYNLGGGDWIAYNLLAGKVIRG